MHRRWFAVAALGLAALVLGLIAYVFDNARASAEVVLGLGEAADLEHVRALEVPVELDDAWEVTRSALPATPSRPSGLVVHVLTEAGEPIHYADVLAYREGELVRAGRVLDGIGNLIPFDGQGTLCVEIEGFEAARLEITDGHGRFDIALPHAASVAGVVRVDGVPCERIAVSLGPQSAGWFAGGLESVGLADRSLRRFQLSERDGSFQFEWLPADWSGALHVGKAKYGMTLNGLQELELELTGPREGLVLDVQPLGPQLVIRGRVVFDGEPVPHALWVTAQQTESSSRQSSGQCDESGRFSVEALEEELRSFRIEFLQPGMGEQEVNLTDLATPVELGDIELLSLRTLPMVVRSASGEPVAGARAWPAASGRVSWREWGSPSLLESDPTDADGECLLHCSSSECTLRVSARGFGLTDVTVPEDLAEPLAVVLPRCAALQVTVRDRSGRVPPGLRLRVAAEESAFTWANGRSPGMDESTPERGGTPREVRRREYERGVLLDERGRAWIDPLRAGVPLRIEAVDEYGNVAGSTGELVLTPEEWRPIDLRVELEPSTLVVLVSDTLGRPIADAAVKVTPRDAPVARSESLMTDRARMVRTEPLYCSEVGLHVSDDGFEARTLDVTVPSQGATVQIRLAHDW